MRTFSRLMKACPHLFLASSGWTPMGSDTQDQRRERLGKVRKEGEFQEAGKKILGLLQGQRQDSWELGQITGKKSAPQKPNA